MALKRLSERLDHRPVATVFKEALGIRCTDRAECLTDDLHQHLSATSACVSEIALELGEGLLYGIEVGRIGWQVDKLTSLTFYEFPDPFSLVGTQVVYHHNLSPPWRGQQNLLKISLENRPIGRALNN